MPCAQAWRSTRFARVPGGHTSFVDEHRRPADEPSEDPEAPLYTSTELEDEDGERYVIEQQNVGPDNELGGGEWPDPHTPPKPPAPGAD
jgi:hypothetical protein